MVIQIEHYLSRLRELSTPFVIQEFLDTLPYNPKCTCCCLVDVLRAGCAHCAEGAFLAAAALHLNGEPLLLVDMRAVNDDDHVIAPFRSLGRWGAIAKGNTTMLRFARGLGFEVRSMPEDLTTKLIVKKL